MRSSIAVLAMLAAGLLAQPAAAAPTLVGQWTFDSPSGGDATGNWSSFQLKGNATIANGLLAVSGTGNSTNAAKGWARADGYSGPTIVDKTLVAWVSLDDLTPGGSPLNLSTPSAGVFDAIVWG